MPNFALKPGVKPLTQTAPGGPGKPPWDNRPVASGNFDTKEALLWSKLPSQKITDAVVKRTNPLVNMLNNPFVNMLNRWG